MDCSGDGRWTGTHAARKAKPGHGTTVATAVLGSGTHAAGGDRGRQGWCRARLGVEAEDDQGGSAGAHGWWLGGGGLSEM